MDDDRWVGAEQFLKNENSKLEYKIEQLEKQLAASDEVIERAINLMCKEKCSRNCCSYEARALLTPAPATDTNRVEKYREVRQEFYDSRFQVLAYKELNQFSGQYLQRWEGFEYQCSDHHEAWCLVHSNAERLKVARLLAKRLGAVGTWKEARALEPVDEPALATGKDES